MMPLAIAPIGKSVRVTKLIVDDKVRKHLENLGILMNSVITPLTDNSGNLIVKVHESRLAINQGLAMKIFVH